MGLDDGADDGQAQAEAIVSALGHRPAVEAVEHVRGRLLTHAHALVAHPEGQAPSRLRRDPLCPQGDEPAGLGVVDGVLHEVEEDLGEAVLVGTDGASRQGVDLPVALAEVGSLGGKRGQEAVHFHLIEAKEVHPRGSGQSEQVGYQTVHPVEFIQHQGVLLLDELGVG